MPVVFGLGGTERTRLFGVRLAELKSGVMRGRDRRRSGGGCRVQPAAGLHYDPTAHQYTYVWATAKS